MNKVAVFVALSCAVSSISVAQKARVDFDHASHFSHYKTYRWVQLDTDSPLAHFPNQLMRERIVGFIEEALAARGLRRVEAGGDLLISYVLRVTEQPQYVTFSDGLGWGWGDGFATTTVETIYKDTLVVDMVESKQQQLVFQGVSSQTVSSKPEKNSKKLAKAVNEIFEKFPPRL